MRANEDRRAYRGNVAGREVRANRRFAAGGGVFSRTPSQNTLRGTLQNAGLLRKPSHAGRLVQFPWKYSSSAWWAGIF